MTYCICPYIGQHGGAVVSSGTSQQEGIYMYVIYYYHIYISSGYMKILVHNIYEIPIMCMYVHLLKISL